jgi:Ca2+/H+ antiporter
MRITSGINRISLGDASCTHNTRSFFFVCVCAFSLLFSYGLCLWHRLTRHRTLKKKKKKKNKKKKVPLQRRRRRDPLLNRP